MEQLLARLALLLSGDWPAARARVAEVQWTLAPGGQWLLLIGLGLAVAIVLLCYSRTTEGLTTRARALLAGLRLVALAALLLMAAGTVCTVCLATTARPALLVVVDDSPSMALPANGTTRWAVANEALRAGLLAQLASAYRVRVTTTSGREPGAEASAAPQSLAEALVLAATRAGGPPPAQMLLLSDGVQTDHQALARAAAELPAPVSCLTFGDGRELRDVVLEDVAVPPFVYQRDQVLVTAQVRSLGLTGEATLQLAEVTGGTEKALASTTVTLRPEGEAAVARLAFAAPAAGFPRYLARVLPVAGEVTDRNNHAAFHLDVRDERIRVLFVEGEPNSEYRFAKEALEADPTVAFYGLVRLPDQEWFYQGEPRRPDGQPVLKDPRQGFPDSATELDFFDVLILGDLERKVFEQSGRFALLAGFVRQHGGGLATIGGLRVYSAGNYEDTELAQLLPFALVHEKKLQLVNRFNPQLTPQGLLHPVMQLEFDPVKNAQAWAGLPWVEGGNAVAGVKPGATLLLAHPQLRTQQGPRPVAAAWPQGPGRVYATALDGTWHWALGRRTDPDYHRRYWGLLVRWLAGDPRRTRGPGSLFAEDLAPEVGQPATFCAMVHDADGKPLLDANVAFTITPPAGPPLAAHALNDPAVPGRYAVTFVPEAPGTHQVRVEILTRAGEAHQAELKCEVASSRQELLQVRPDAPALAALAQASGGTTALIGDWRTLQLPPPPARGEARVVVARLWQAPWLAALLVGCLVAEWFIRKRRGLA